VKPSEKYKLDERNHVEKPLLDQLSGLGWEIIDLTEEKQTPGHYRSVSDVQKHRTHFHSG
jgi:type I restriction enzyme R subunit